MRFAKRLISVARATLICLNNDMIDIIALIYSPVLRGTKSRMQIKKNQEKEDQSA